MIYLNTVDSGCYKCISKMQSKKILHNNDNNVSWYLKTKNRFLSCFQVRGQGHPLPHPPLGQDPGPVQGHAQDQAPGRGHDHPLRRERNRRNNKSASFKLDPERLNPPLKGRYLLTSQRKKSLMWALRGQTEETLLEAQDLLAVILRQKQRVHRGLWHQNHQQQVTQIGCLD